MVQPFLGDENKETKVSGLECPQWFADFTEFINEHARDCVKDQLKDKFKVQEYTTTISYLKLGLGKFLKHIVPGKVESDNVAKMLEKAQDSGKHPYPQNIVRHCCKATSNFNQVFKCFFEDPQVEDNYFSDDDLESNCKSHPLQQVDKTKKTLRRSKS